MDKKKTTEDQIIEEAVNTIMHTIHVAAIRIADKYERKLMNEVMESIQIQIEANEEAKKFSGNYINDKLNDLSKE